MVLLLGVVVCWFDGVLNLIVDGFFDVVVFDWNYLFFVVVEDGY